ncbi:MAG TPA: NAD(P)/FAD-dependent oxidoreductase [Pyrinomonadaceae bacterium]|jgi:flavin-dependent dehydrogenase|nr:NAD(P)/FAD-dependent oxidoreductase [Pyrinomonadaceae bacterium]
MSGAEEFDAVVVGAGLAGLQCARLLAGGARRVLLVDAKRALDERVHTTGIFVRRTLEDFDLPADCLSPAVRRVTLYSPARRELTIESPRDEFRVGRMSRLYARLLEECVRGGARWSPATRYLGCNARGGRGRTVVWLESAGLTRMVKTKFVVGADGARSRVARDLKLDCNREWIVGVEEVYEGVPLSAGEPRFHCFLDPRLAPGYLAWVVEDGEETHVGVGGYAARFDAARALEKFRASLRGQFDFGRARLVERRGGRIPVGGVLRRIACARGLLVGDAAGAVSPLTAGGLDPALRLSTLAARVIADYLETNDAASLAPYSGAHYRARFTSRLWMRRAIRSVNSPLAAEGLCAALRLPLADRVARHVFFGRGSFPDVGVPAAVAPLSQKPAI